MHNNHRLSRTGWQVRPFYANGGALFVNDIAIGTDGSVVTAGYFYNTVDFAPGPADTANASVFGYSDIFIAKYDKTGKLL